ncbi:hypothetical protein [Bradyrhizobium sp. C9]|uniref:DUF6894 family protein n=1 Tax=Bradyrhizobium sp. C9 TaxID=142585 RepID=UPI000BE92621|nr:hypothetical protein [Bradyrhizobium sp. C9]PDT73470.1 hypothetical protein CO675_30900 [Bradyrhizobium sp. C9]
MGIYYFDLRDGVRKRDRSGIQFRNDGEAISHSEIVAEKIRSDEPTRRGDLCIIVIDESGREVHREEVFPSTSPAA